MATTFDTRRARRRRLDDYRLLAINLPSLVEYLLAGPKLDDESVDLLNERSRDTGRDIEL